MVSTKCNVANNPNFSPVWVDESRVGCESNSDPNIV